MEDFIKKKCSEVSDVFQNVTNQGCIKTLDYSIEISKLHPDYATKINITEQGDFVDMFKELRKEEYEHLPAIYIFKINPDINSKTIIDAIDSISSIDLNVPAHYKYPKNNGILYVGKVKRCAWGRLIQHLGYHKDSKSHGLQIQRWANKISEPFNLTYTVMFFEKEIADYLVVLETAIAKMSIYKPIIGKH
jgi:hypothetical protein